MTKQTNRRFSPEYKEQAVARLSGADPARSTPARPALGRFPALERRVDPTTRTGLVFLSRYAAPEDIRTAGAKCMVRKLTKAATGLRGLEALAEDSERPHSEHHGQNPREIKAH